jgi:putative flavoprotein involved in K+ transport
MNTTQIETVVIGAGQAGLATGYHLQRHGRPFVILDASSRIGENWRRLWDTLAPYSPAQYDSQPGLPFPAKKWTFPGKDQVGDYLETYARHFQPRPPVGQATRLRQPPRTRRRRVHDRARFTIGLAFAASGSSRRGPRTPTEWYPVAIAYPRPR